MHSISNPSRRLPGREKEEDEMALSMRRIRLVLWAAALVAALVASTAVPAFAAGGGKEEPCTVTGPIEEPGTIVECQGGAGGGGGGAGGGYGGQSTQDFSPTTFQEYSGGGGGGGAGIRGSGRGGKSRNTAR